MGRVLALLWPVAITFATGHVDRHTGPSFNAPCNSFFALPSGGEVVSDGIRRLPAMRPAAGCRTFNSAEVEAAIEQTAQAIEDPDLKMIFQNALPNTLDSTVAWRGSAADNPDEELAFVITGDIPAMWLRDSANQLQSYAAILKPSSDKDSLASLFRGVINLQARYLRTFPYCNAFQAPKESGMPKQRNWAYTGYDVRPEYSSDVVYECKYELDSLAHFLQLSYTYYTKTGDLNFFSRFGWIQAVQAVVDVAHNQSVEGTYHDDGTMVKGSYMFSTFVNSGYGNPVVANTGLVRSFFRPSDDDTIYQLFIPANMQFSRFLNATAEIVERLGGGEQLGRQMKEMAATIRAAITQHGIVHTEKHGDVYAFEVDGYGGVNLMDDANSPSLLAAPRFGYLDKDDIVYQNTRSRILSTDNPYWNHGKEFSAIGGPHSGPEKPWPMAAIVRILTTDDDDEITQQLHMLINSTAGTGLIHESVRALDVADYTRAWFAWANGLFGEMIMDLHARKPDLLKHSFQNVSPGESFDEAAALRVKSPSSGTNGVQPSKDGTDYQEDDEVTALMGTPEGRQTAHSRIDSARAIAQASVSYAAIVANRYWFWSLVAGLSICSLLTMFVFRSVRHGNRSGKFRSR